MKKLNKIAIFQRTNEQIFMWNIYNLLEYKGLTRTKEFIEATAIQTLNMQYPLIKSYSEMIDKIRYTLLINAGIKKPIIKDTSIWKKIKEAL